MASRCSVVLLVFLTLAGKTNSRTNLRKVRWQLLSANVSSTDVKFRDQRFNVSDRDLLSMRNLENKPDPSRGLQLVLPNMDEYVPGAPITPTASIPAAAYKPHWSGALHISTEAKAYAERPKINGGGLFMPPETQILAVHNEAARLRTGVAERSIRVALIVASEWIDRAVNTSHDRNTLRSCLKESNGFYSAMEGGTAALDKALRMADAVYKRPTDPPLAERSREILTTAGKNFENASRFVFNCSKKSNMNMISRVCLMAGFEYIREAALRAYGQWASVDKQNVDQAVARAWQSLRKFEEGEYKSEHNVLVNNVKDKVLESLESEKRAKQMADSYMMGNALSPRDGDESNQTDAFKPHFSTLQFCNQMLCNVDSNETDQALLYSGCLHGCVGVLKGATDASLKQVHRGQSLHTCDDYCDGVARSPALTPKLYELLNKTASRSIWVGSCLRSCGRALTVREGGNIKLPEGNAGLKGGNQSTTPPTDTLSGSEGGKESSPQVPCETPSPFVRCSVTPIKSKGSGAKRKTHSLV